MNALVMQPGCLLAQIEPPSPPTPAFGPSIGAIYPFTYLERITSALLFVDKAVRKQMTNLTAMATRLILKLQRGLMEGGYVLVESIHKGHFTRKCHFTKKPRECGLGNFGFLNYRCS